MNTYLEHETHVRHRTRVPVDDVLVERSGILQYSEGRMAAWSKRRCIDGVKQEEMTNQKQRQLVCINMYPEYASHIRH